MVSRIFSKVYEFHRRFWKIASVLTIAAAVALAFVLHYVFTHESCDDAFIEGDVTVISPRVSGYIEKVYVNDNQPVKAGDLLCNIDPRDYKAAFDLAKADLQAKQDDADQAKQDVARYTKLLATKDISQRQFDMAMLRWNTDKAKVDAARARLEQAELELSYTKITSPADGTVTKKSVEPGMSVQQGQALMAVVFPDRWVVANLKETQMTHVHPGLEVVIHVDAYPGAVFHGHVDSIQQGTGSKFSLLPAENATGNYIKVVQRVPVKIIFDGPLDPKRPLVLGMSVVPVIDLSSGKTK
ncbi:MAG: HlyD family secretion protein [Candidatus Omnitrophica bacterium]|nr:HlyD family secretion protein [Candidatus Omnitrophota bacterium]